MTLLEQRILELLPLDRLELAFRHIYQQGIPYSQIDSDSPDIRAFFTGEESLFRSFYTLKNIVESMHENETLSDKIFFRPEQNVSIIKHVRYMPSLRHSHDFFEIQFLLAGKLTQTFDDVTLTLETGDLCFIAPNVMHCPMVMDDNAVLVNLLVRSGTLRSAFANSLADRDVISEFFLRVLSGQTFQPILLCRTMGDEHIAHLVMEMLLEEGNTDIYTDKLLRTMMEQLFILLLRDHKDDFDLGRSPLKHDDTILTVLRYLQANYATVSLSSLAKHFSYTETYLSHLIKDYTGKTFSNTVAELRLRAVAQRLAASDESINSIMLDMGYSDKTHFYRMFRRHFGVTPAEYRQSQKEGNHHETTH